MPKIRICKGILQVIAIVRKKKFLYICSIDRFDGDTVIAKFFFIYRYFIQQFGIVARNLEMHVELVSVTECFS